jgi:hypothetical protein
MLRNAPALLALVAGQASALSGTPLPENPLRPFQVQQPLSNPGIKPCSVVLLEHVFSNSYGQPAIANYTPPLGCGSPGSWSSVIVNLTASSNGVSPSDPSSERVHVGSILNRLNTIALQYVVSLPPNITSDHSIDARAYTSKK